MDKSVFVAVGALGAVLIACSSTVVYEDDGSGGSGGAPQPSTGQTKSNGGATKSTSMGPTTYNSGATTYDSGPTSQQSSVYTTGGMGCDGMFDCTSCQECAFGSTCADEYEECFENDPECLGLANCYSNCPVNDQACFDTCAMEHEAGVDPYFALATCVFCDACYVSCDGLSAGC